MFEDEGISMYEPKVCERCLRGENECYVDFCKNPYQSEIYDSHELYLLCGDCYENIRGDI